MLSPSNDQKRMHTGDYGTIHTHACTSRHDEHSHNNGTAHTNHDKDLSWHLDTDDQFASLDGAWQQLSDIVAKHEQCAVLEYTLLDPRQLAVWVVSPDGVILGHALVKIDEEFYVLLNQVRFCVRMCVCVCLRVCLCSSVYLSD